MFNSYFHLKYLSDNLNSKFRSLFVTSIFTFEKGKLHIAISNGNCIVFSITNPLPYLTIKEKTPYPKSKVSLFKEIHGLQITGIKININDRQIIFDFESSNYLLLFNCYGINGNVFLFSKNYDFIDSFKKKEREIPVISQDLIHNFKNPEEVLLQYEDLNQFINQFQDKRIIDLLKNYYNRRFDKVLIQEICYRSGIDEKKQVSTLKDIQIEKLINSIKQIFDEINQKNFYIYYDELPIFSLINLESRKKVDFKIFGNCLNATNEYISRYFSDFQFRQEKTNLIKILEKYISLNERKLVRQQNDLKNIKSPDIYREWAETIIANYNRVSEKSDFVILPRLTNPEEKIKIPLIKGLSPEENAKKYFQKARNIENSKEVLIKAINETENKINRAKELIGKIEKIKIWRELKEYTKKIKSIYQPVVRKKEQQERLLYVQINYKGWEILIGRSAKDNDELTFNIAKPNDFWFHTQYVPGSHVIIRNPKKADNLPEEIIKIAAGLAAFNSKDKNSKLIPVIYTKKKYVWKPKKSEPGVAAYKFEKSIMVEPINPQAIQ
ncbi:MAG: DUF814 domain-containing protein [Candidatus Marinimicrobia bacterium]|nr:DUF814 domain-containing protein [Candidatus Neomarinimicrobiota bacterium]